MKDRLTPHTAHGSSAAVAAWLRLLRSPAAVGVLLAVLIALLAWSRFTGASWTALAMPFDLREHAGNTSQWEQIHHFNALRATLQSEAGWVIEDGRYNTDHYRGLLLAYSAAVLSYWLDSSYKGIVLVDLLGWSVAAWTLYYLARRLGADNLSALIAAVLLAASPLFVSHMWRNSLHVAHSASLVPCFLAAQLLLIDERLVHVWRVVGLASVLYVASLTYQFQWIIVPCLLSLAVVERRRWAWLLSIVAAAVLFVGMTFFTYQTLGLVGLSVSSQSNDPFVVVNSLLALSMESDVPGLGSSFVRSIGSLSKAYHPYIVFLSMIGLFFAHARLRILVLTGIALGLAAGYFDAVPWVVMNGYPFLYISAGLALVQGPRWLADTISRIGGRRWPHSAVRMASRSRVLAGLSTAVLMLLAVLSTNMDLLGEYGFAQQYLGYIAW